jgi:lysophospholipase L1-like esterase
VNPNPGSGNAGLQQGLGSTGFALVSTLPSAEGSRYLQLQYWNGYVQAIAGNNVGEVNGPNPVTIRMSLLYPSGAWQQVGGSTAWSSTTAYGSGQMVVYAGRVFMGNMNNTTPGTPPTSALGSQWIECFRYLVSWPGQDVKRRIVVSPGAVVTSDLIDLGDNNRIHSGYSPYCGITTTVETGSSTGYWCPGDGSGVLDFVVNHTGSIPTPGGTSDPVDSGFSTQTSLAAGANVPLPVVVLGDQGHSPGLLLGDSILQGYGDSRAIEQLGWGARATEAWPWRKAAKGGAQASQYTNSNAYRATLLDGADWVVSNFGINEINAGKSLATVQGDLAALWTQLANTGRRVWHCTVLPFTSSTDNWATTANQTAPASPAGAWGGAGIWWQLNRWLRDGAPLIYHGTTQRAGDNGHALAGVLDVAANVTDPVTGWKWRPGSLTLDGAHPNAAGAALVAAGARPWMGTVALGRDLFPPPEQARSHVSAWTLSPEAASGALLVAGGTIYAARIQWPGGTLSQLHTWISTAGGTLTSGQCLMGVYTVDGALLGVTASQHTAWSSTGDKIAPLVSAVWAPAGELWIAWLANGTTKPTFAASPAAAALNANTGGQFARAGTVAAGQTSLPSTLAFTAITVSTQAVFGAAS